MIKIQLKTEEKKNEVGNLGLAKRERQIFEYSFS